MIYKAETWCMAKKERQNSAVMEMKQPPNMSVVTRIDRVKNLLSFQV